MLDDYRRSLGGRPAQTPAHITLAPPTDVAPEVRDHVLPHLEQAARLTAPFPVHLRGTGTFRPVSPVVFIGVVAGISGCEQLAARVRSGPLGSPPSFPYHPHVTIAHDLPDEALDQAFAEQASFEAAWTVSAFVLSEHTDHAGWRVVRTLGLNG